MIGISELAISLTDISWTGKHFNSQSFHGQIFQKKKHFIDNNFIFRHIIDIAQTNHRQTHYR